MVKSLTQRLRNELRCSVAEVDYNENYQRCQLGVVVASGTASGAQKVADRVERIVLREVRVEIISTGITIVSDDD